MQIDNPFWKILDLRVHGDERGKLVAIEGGVNCPFEVKRAFYIFGAQGEARRGKHANKNSEFLFIALKGSCRVEFSDGTETQQVLLNNPTQALWLGKMTWKEMFDFEDGTVLLVLSSEKYDANEYIRDNEVFKNITGGGSISP